MATQLLIYERAVPVSQQRHRDWYIKTGTDYAFASKVNSVPLVGAEVTVAAQSYPIVFAGDADLVPVVLLGVRDGENLFIKADGTWDAKYIPAFVRRYPFVFAADEGSDRLLLCVDRAAPMVSNQPDVPFFENGQPSKFTQDAVEFCKEFERQRRATLDFVKMIGAMDLFEQKTVAFQPRDAQGRETGPQQKVADYWAISEERLNALPQDKYLELRNNGALGACYAHLVSLLNWSKVIQRAVRTPPPGQAAA